MSERKILIFACVFAIAVVAFHFYAKKQPAAEESRKTLEFFRRPLKWQGKYAPDFELELLGGEKFRLSEEIGRKTVILNFFATWCGPCREEMPELVSYYEKHRKEPFILIGIDSDEKESKVRDFVDERGITFPVGIDISGEIQRRYTVKGFPTTVFIGADGKVEIYEVGPVTNADIAFDGFHRKSMEMIEKGAGISREAYLQEIKKQGDTSSGEKEKEKDDGLRGRAKEIAAEMDCPCGCPDKVIDCGCKTAKGIRERLGTADPGTRSDAEIIKDLNREFCVGNDKG